MSKEGHEPDVIEKLNAITVIVGHNNAGKTQVLRATLQNIVKEPRPKQAEMIDSTKIIAKMKQMLGGKYTTTKIGMYFDSLEGVENSFSIPINQASSFVVKMANPYLFVSFAEKGSTLIIDEPENCLSPHNQIDFARVMVMCANAGLKVFVTTHSDFLITELNNLIMLNSEFKGKDIFLHNQPEYDSSMFLDPSKIDVYFCSDAQLTKYEVDQKGVDAYFFTEVIHRLGCVQDELSFYIDHQKTLDRMKEMDEAEKIKKTRKRLNPSDFITNPYGSKLGDSQAETVAVNIMVFLKRIGDVWKKLSWEEYAFERRSDNPCLEEKELNLEEEHFNKVISYCESAEKAKTFSISWKTLITIE